MPDLNPAEAEAVREIARLAIELEDSNALFNVPKSNKRGYEAFCKLMLTICDLPPDLRRKLAKGGK